VARLLRAVHDGRGGVLLVEGESGIGKSRLLDEAVETGTAMGFMIARGAAEELGRVVPLGPLMSAFKESTQTLLGPRELANGVDVRLRLVEGLQARLEERAARGPLLVTLDDLHWADPMTLMALRSLIPELASYPLVWVLSRTTGRGDTGAERLYEVLERDCATRIVLGALGERAVAEIITDVLGTAPSPELVRLAAGAGGNPFLLVELFCGLCDEHTVQTVEGQARTASSQLPRRIQEIAYRRLRGLSPRTRYLLQVAAILGRSFDADDVADMLGEPPTRLLPALEEAEAAGVVVPGPDLLSFRHDLLRLAVTETMVPSVRQALHRQAGRMLLDRGGPAVVAAAHLMESVRPGDVAALTGLDRAVREVLPTSPETAADLAVRALELTAPDDADRSDRALTAVNALTIAGRMNEAEELARAALRTTRSPGHTAQLRYELANALRLAGRMAEAAAEAENALIQGDLPDELRGLIEIVLFQGPLGNSVHRRVRRRAETVLAAPQHYSKPSLTAAHLVLTDVAWNEGRVADGLGHNREAARTASGDAIQRTQPYIINACLLTHMRRLREAENAIQVAAEEITARGTTAYAAAPAILRARLRLAEGRLDDAAAEARAGLATADELGAHLYDPFGFTVLAIVALRHGDLEAAAGYADHCRSHYAPGIDAMSAWWWLNWGPALVAEAQGGLERAIDLLHAPYTDPAERCSLLMVEADAAACLTRTALAAGDRTGAEVITATAERLARDNPDFPTLAAAAAHAHGLLHHDAGALATAATTHVGPWSGASASEDLGVLHARACGEVDRETAIHHFDQALKAYQETGARRDAARVRARLRRLGVRRRHWGQSKRPAFGWDSLTDTERNVATLAAQGLTNPQIATRMFISRDTVKFHLSQIFRKLNIASRVELARLTTQHLPNRVTPCSLET
jgi:ATP/maltotriose-dependent transcriptional regulator MalT